MSSFWTKSKLVTPCLSPPTNQSPSKGDLRRTLLLRSPSDPCGPPGGRRGPKGTRRARGDAVACPGGPNINRAPIRDSQATCRMTTCPELRGKAHILGGPKTDMPQKINYFWFYCNSPNGSSHSNCTAILCKEVWSIRKVTVRLPKSCVLGHRG